MNTFQKIAVFTFCCCLALAPLVAQTTLISPTGDGGFETGTTFANNGWTKVGTSNNQYQIGTAAGQFAGSRCAFISNSASAWTSSNPAANRHLYRNVTFPANETEIRLTFCFKTNVVQTEETDGFTVRIIDASVTPTTLGYPAGDLIYPSLIYGGAANTWYVISISVPATYAGTTKRLVFSWYNNNGNPRTLGALDNIELTSRVPATVSTLPYQQNFDSISPVALPTGWTQINSAAYRPWRAASSSTIGYHSSPYFAFATYSPTATKNEWMISPPIAVSSGRPYKIKFWVKAPGYGAVPEKLKVHWGTAPTVASFTANPALYDNPNMFVTDWTEVVVDYTATFTGNVYFGWHAYSGVDVDYIAIDDVTILEDTPLYSVTPESWDFRSVDYGSDPESQIFTISNTGGGTLTITDPISLAGDDRGMFDLTDNNFYPIQLTDNQSTTVKVTYCPDSIGQHSAYLSFSDNRQARQIPLSGRCSYLVYGDSFESHTDFTLNLSPWTQYDGDGSTTYGILNYTFTNNYYTGSYLAFNPNNSSPALTGNWLAKKGDKYAACFDATTSPNNDWLISPQLSFRTNPRISFWAKSITDNDGLERFKVLYSTTGNSSGDFTNYLAGSAGTYVEAPIQWTYYSYDLPAAFINGSGYIAIQCVSNDAFVFMLDDFAAWSDELSTPVFSINPSTHTFDTPFINYSQLQQFTITNTGFGTLQLVTDGITISGNTAFQLIDLPALPLNLTAYQSTSFWVEFYPTIAGDYAATLNVTDNLSKVTHYAPLNGKVADNTVSSFPYFEGFEEDMYGWMKRDSDADGNNWFPFTNTEALSFAYSGVNCALSQSWKPDTRTVYLSKPRKNNNTAKAALTPDNWMFSPPFVIGENYILTWQVAAQDPAWPAEKYSVLISTTTPEIDQFTAIFTETLAVGGWQYRQLPLTLYNGETVYLAFRHYDCTNQFILKLDEIKVLAPNTEINQSLVSSGSATMTINPIQDLYQNLPVSVGLELSGLNSGSVVTADVGYGNPYLPITNPGLHIRAQGAGFAGSTFTVHHNLGFVPLQAAWRIVPGAWNIISSISPIVLVWTNTTVSITLPDSKANGDVEMVFPPSQDGTLPVELSNFSVGFTPANLVQVLWVSQSETNLVGYRIYRGENSDIELAIMLDIFVDATNTSQQQVYVYVDKDILASGTYYYWLEHLEMDGSAHLHGPVAINYVYNNPNNPEIPVVTGITAIYPNPFNPETTINFGLSQPASYSLKIYNLKGQLVRNLSEGNLPRGYHTVKWNGMDDTCNLTSSGVYFIILNSGKDSFKRKVIMLK